MTTKSASLWELRLPSIAHTISLSPDHSRVLISSNDAAVEVDAFSAKEISRISDLPASAWASAYLHDGSRLIACRNGLLNAYSVDDEITWSVLLGSYPKRLYVDHDRVFVTGGGGIKEYAIGESKPTRIFRKLLDNTAENCAIIDGLLCVVTYGMQIAAYDHESGELRALYEDLPDYPKGIAALHGRDGEAYLAVGGRGGFIRLYRVDRNAQDGQVLTPLRDLWLVPAYSARGATSISLPHVITDHVGTSLMAVPGDHGQ